MGEFLNDCPGIGIQRKPRAQACAQPAAECRRGEPAAHQNRDGDQQHAKGDGARALHNLAIDEDRVVEGENLGVPEIMHLRGEGVGGGVHFVAESDTLSAGVYFRAGELDQFDKTGKSVFPLGEVCLFLLERFVEDVPVGKS